MASSVRALPASGDVFLDARDQGRALRFSWHQERELAVLSIWRGDTCVSSFQLDRDDVPRLVETLVRGLAGQPGHTRAPRLQNLG